MLCIMLSLIQWRLPCWYVMDHLGECGVVDSDDPTFVGSSECAAIVRLRPRYSCMFAGICDGVSA
jgi:hypothetical protein